MKDFFFFFFFTFHADVLQSMPVAQTLMLKEWIIIIKSPIS